MSVGERDFEQETRDATEEAAASTFVGKGRTFDDALNNASNLALATFNVDVLEYEIVKHEGTGRRGNSWSDHKVTIIARVPGRP
jgi:hypothetical protein